jgi:hypothetical protein
MYVYVHVCVCVLHAHTVLCCVLYRLIVCCFRPQLADIRERRYMQAEGLDSFYFFRVDDCWIVDATKVLRLPRCITSACAVVTFRAETQSGALHQPLV